MNRMQTGVGEVPEFPGGVSPSLCWRPSDCRYQPTGLNGKDASGRGQRDYICPNWPQLMHLTLE